MTALVVAAYEEDVKGLIKAVDGAAPELVRPGAEFLAETAFLMLPMPWAVGPACSAARRPPLLPLCVQCAPNANAARHRTERPSASVEDR